MDTIRFIPPSTAAPLYPYQEPDTAAAHVYEALWGEPDCTYPVKLRIRSVVQGQPLVDEEASIEATRPEDV